MITQRQACSLLGAALSVLALLSAGSAPLLAGQDLPHLADTLRLARLDGPVVLDGMPDEPAWQAVPPLPMTMYTPHFGGELTERSEIRVAYDDEYFWVSGRLYDADPRGIRMNTLYRDRYSGDDLLAVILDTFDDHETGSWFVVNPAGALTDRALSSDAEFTSGSPMNEDWNTFWDAATRVTDEGWFAEMRIPFSSLGFQDHEGRVVMGMILYRFIARKNERQLFPAIPPIYGPLGFAKVSRSQRIVLERVYGRRPVYVTPYLLGGVSRAAELNAAGTLFRADEDVTREAGLDFRYSPTSNLNLDLTVNTDFAQVEVDDEQVNLTRFSLFFPEKRQFFQERAAIFDFNTGGLSRLFHSRQIGLAEIERTGETRAEPIRLLGGARLVGRVGGTDIGLLNLQTASESGLPSENFGALRVRQQVFNPFSTAGGMVTTRVSDDGAYNVAAGVDAVVRVIGDDYVTLKAIHTFDDVEGTGADVDNMRVLASWERRNQRGFSYIGEFIRSGVAYAPGLGFALRHDFWSLANGLQYQWFPGARSPVRTFAIGNGAQVFVRNVDGTVESASIEPSVQTELKSGAELSFTLGNSYESVRDSFDLAGGVPVPPGDYWFHAGVLRYQASRAARIRPTFTLSAGSFFDGSRVSFNAEPAWNPSRHLEINAGYQFEALRFNDRNASFDVHLARLRVQTALNVHLSLATFAQYNNTTDEFGLNVRFRYHFREGRDLWLVYNETMNVERDVVGSPPLPLSQDRTVMVKYSHTLIW